MIASLATSQNSTQKTKKTNPARSDEIKLKKKKKKIIKKKQTPQR
jgi:hypothetical protein